MAELLCPNAVGAAAGNCSQKMPVNNFLGTGQVQSCASSISLLQTYPKSSHTRSWAGSTPCHCWKGQKFWQHRSTSPLTPGMLPSVLCCCWHIFHETDLAAWALAQPELISLLQERTARCSGKTRLPCSRTCPRCVPHLGRMLSRLPASRRELSLMQEAFAVHAAAVCSWSMTGQWGSCEPGHHSILLLLARSRLWGLLFCSLMCHASESTAKSFSECNNFSLQSSRVFPPIPVKSRSRSAEILSNTS